MVDIYSATRCKHLAASRSTSARSALICLRCRLINLVARRAPAPSSSPTRTCVLPPLLTGGGQERRRRAGTENVAAIAGFGVAARLADHHLSDMPRMSALRSQLEAQILAVSPEAVIFGSAVDRLPNTTLFAAPGVSAATAVIGFDLEGIAVSAGFRMFLRQDRREPCAGGDGRAGDGLAVRVEL